MKRVLLFLVSILITTGISIQSKSFDKMYAQRSAGDESIFFIYPQTLTALADSKSISKSLDYDYTYVQKTDSVAMLISLTLKEPVNKIDTEISCSNSTFKIEPELIFAKPKGNKITYRLRVTMPFKDFEEIYASKTPFILSFLYVIDGEREQLNFGYNQKNWDENRKNINRIINLIKINTRKNDEK